ncbi:hypothetical protein PF008_g3485 [Phytophthora fragariae]|uniref:Crinkler effector protein N-terminal domain-containing protein n=1 Tax=Phytophthora fragariae TaxID=53985 RepID=A0A6G0SE30_9STRA|nr:hypothetical protein PF008_g3485 [Phytophthora fragariae]
MVQLELTCTIVGEGRAFDVKVDDRWKATKLQEAIQTKNKNDLGKVDAKDLQLYLAKKDGIWLTSAGAASVALGGDETLHGFEKMDPTLFIKNPKYFGANFQPGEGEVHVLVVVLKSPAGGVTAAATMTEEIPGAKRQRTEAAVDRTTSLNGRLVPIIEMAQQLNPETRLTVGSWLDIPLTNLGRFDTGLFVRKEYWDLHKMIKQRLESNDKIYRVLVVGSPGIGKSVFGVFLLLVLMVEKKDVAYRVFGQVAPYYFSWNGTKYEISRTPAAGKRYEGLFDGDDTGGALDSFLFLHAYVFASPRTTNYNHFVKEGCFKVCMNPWTKTECQQLADALHLDDEDQDDWLRRYNLVGGNPRFLFSTAETLDSLVERVKGDVPHDIEDLKRKIHLGIVARF